MEDANDFSWQAAKASHAVMLCRMEEGKVEWHETHKLDRIGTKPRPQRWEARVLPLCHCGPLQCRKVTTDDKQPFNACNNSELLSRNSLPKIIQSADQKPVKMCRRHYLPENKYKLALAVKNKNKQKLQSVSSDPTYQKWSDQNKQKFGFVPLGPLFPKSNLKHVIGTDPIKLDDVTKNSDSFNFMSKQIQVKSQLNLDVWEQCLDGYWDSWDSYAIL